jgi:hypothetical protein
MTVQIDDNVCRSGSRQIGRVVCATSDAADSSPRVIVEWEGGEETTVCESELTKYILIYFPRSREQAWMACPRSEQEETP